jgi:hypothetical protein
MMSSWPLSTLDEGHELLDVEGTVSVPRHFTCWDLHGGVEADELAPLIVKPGDFDESLLADPLDIGVEVACFQAGVAEKPLLVARSAHCRRCARAPLAVAPSPLSAVGARLATKVPDLNGRLIVHHRKGFLGALDDQALEARELGSCRAGMGPEKFQCPALPALPVHHCQGHKKNQQRGQAGWLEPKWFKTSSCPPNFSNHMKTLPNQPTHM